MTRYAQRFWYEVQDALQVLYGAPYYGRYNQ